jgi:hypothetical protein
MSPVVLLLLSSLHDDSKLHRTIDKADDYSSFQGDLDCLHTWTLSWGLEFLQVQSTAYFEKKGCLMLWVEITVLVMSMQQIECACAYNCRPWDHYISGFILDKAY